MSTGLEKTLELLATTPNDAAGDVLWHALQSASNVASRKLALKGILRRRSAKALRHVIEHWHTFCVELKDVATQHRGRLTGAIRDAIVSRDDQLCANGCDAALLVREYEIVPALVTVVRSKEARQAEIAARTMIELVQELYIELNQSRDSRTRRDSQLAHAHVSSALEAAVRQYPQHQRKDILTAFLITAGRENATLKNILREPLDPTHSALVELLAQSPRPAIARLTASFLEDGRAPQAALTILSRRSDDLFVEQFLRAVGDDPSPNVRRNLKRLTSIDWLQSGLSQLTFLDEQAQVAFAQAVGNSGLPHHEIMGVFKNLLRSGKLRARRAVAEMLVAFQGVEPNRLVMQALRDDDVQVQAAALSQLRERGLPGAMATLIEALDSEHPLLRETARECLSEFDLPRYLNAFEGMSDEVRRNTGQLVSKVDVHAATSLREEMESLSRSRRLRAIEVAQSLGLIQTLEEPLLQLLSDDDHLIRLEAAEALAECPTDKTRMALRNATLDSSPAVCTAAQRALDEMVFASSQPTKGPNPEHVQSFARGRGGRSW